MGVTTGMSFPRSRAEAEAMSVVIGGDPAAFEVLRPYFAYECDTRHCADAYMFLGISRGLASILRMAPGPSDPGQHALFLATARVNFRAYLRSIRDRRMRIRTALRRELEWKGLLSHMGAAVLLLWGIPAIVWVAAKLWGAALAALAGS